MKHKLPATYQAARNALALATRIDEVKHLRDKTLAMEVYAYQAKDKELVALSTEMKRRAQRRLGQLMAVAEKARAGRPSKKIGVLKTPILSLAAQGIDKGLAKAARRDAAMPEPIFEASVAKDVKVATAVVEGGREIIAAIRAEHHQEKLARRIAREKQLGARQRALPVRKYGVILADPEWRFEFWSEKLMTNSSAANHYPTSDLQDIKERNVTSISADDAVLFLWATVPMLPQAIEVMNAWGFRYVSQFVWVKKGKVGTGYWNRNQHELLLIGTRGNIPLPAPGTQPSSVIEAPGGKHSQKPLQAYEIIEIGFWRIC
jgi:N6-adenosine-specific RNA methylase IME4